MALTRDFKETVQARAQRDPVFRQALLEDGIACLLAGDVETGKIVLRDYINATISSDPLSPFAETFEKSGIPGSPSPPPSVGLPTVPPA